MKDIPKPSIFEVTRRYAACIYALSEVLGLAPYTLLKEHHAAIATVFLEASRNGIRLDDSVHLPLIYSHIVKGGSE